MARINGVVQPCELCLCFVITKAQHVRQEVDISNIEKKNIFIYLYTQLTSRSLNNVTSDSSLDLEAMFYALKAAFPIRADDAAGRNRETEASRGR